MDGQNQYMIENGLTAFADLRAPSQSATRSSKVVSRVYQASNRSMVLGRYQSVDYRGKGTKAPVNAYNMSQD